MATEEIRPVSLIDDIPLLQLAEWTRARLAREVGTMSRSLLAQVTSSYKLVYMEAQSAMDTTYELPPEVLGLIFRYVPGSPLDDYKDDPDDHALCYRDHLIRSSDVVPLMRVCRRWRAVAINMAELWTTIDDRKQVLYDDHVARAKILPLKLFIHSKPRSGCRQWLRMHAPTIQEFHYIRAAQDDRYAILRVYLPNIRAATLVVNSVNMYDNEFELFGGTTSLRELCLRRLSWLPTNHLPHLTRLFLAQWRGTCDIAQLMSFLARCPNLVDITLSRPFLGRIVTASEDTIAELPQLRRLTMRDLPPDEIAACLLHIRARPDTALCIRTTTDPLTAQDVSSISRFRTIASCTMLHILSTGEGVFSLTALGQASGVYIEQVHIPEEEWEEALAQISFLPQIEELWLVEKGCSPLPHTVVHKILRRMGAFKLRTLVTTGEGLREVSAALVACLGDNRQAIQDIHVFINRQSENTDDPFAQSAMRQRFIVNNNIMATATDLAGVSEIVRSKTSERNPCMKLPVVCATQSELWPAWHTFLTLL
ncbi:uncharacterized protein B0H18DRAFT_102717 [Fomitopsis serialis]|uniref:uncharacterized protein n=1 Tax=Fomitopsis serialis TaxID=139415 RepID=UPI002007444C|nr:uncharacterized protein B0H18DRAFT_102717 [Neoantrodia serialis]KAH9931277.1 hypothetical protein B0H18DRAFT_102717 [Neoantrodia serialis]